MAVNVVNPVIINVQRTWPEDATLTLIRYRRRYHDSFEDRSNRDHTDIWTRIANRIQTLDNFIVSGHQCRTKWQALKRGYENIRRMLDGNPDGFPVHSPNTYDTRFFNELSDEFWNETSNYPSNDIKNNYLINLSYLHYLFLDRYQRAYREHRIDRRRYEHRERGRSRYRSRSRNRSRSRDRSRNRSRSPSRDSSRDRRRRRRRHRRRHRH